MVLYIGEIMLFAYFVFFFFYAKKSNFRALFPFMRSWTQRFFFQFFYLFTNNIKDQGENYIGENWFFGVGGIFFSMPLSAYLCVVK